MRANQADHPVATMCRLPNVSSSAYDAWRRREASEHARRDEVLAEQIRAIHEGSGGTYGAPRIHAELVDRGEAVGRKRVARLMRALGLRGAMRRRTPKTTKRGLERHDMPVRVDRDFRVGTPNQPRVADITYVPTDAGFLYLAVVVDAFSRRVVGWSMEDHPRTSLVLSALDMAVMRRRPSDDIHHSDQGCQYTSYASGSRCRQLGVRPSTGTVGNCYDNALCESFSASVECEVIQLQRFRNPDETRAALFYVMEARYDPWRRHSGLDHQAPVAFERIHRSTTA